MSTPSFNYNPNRTPEQLEHERLLETLALTHEQRFRRMMKLIRASQKIKDAKVLIDKKVKS